MELMLTPIGLLTFVTLISGFIYYSGQSPLGAISLPCVAALTSLIYFYIMPAFYMAGGNYEFFGMLLTSLEGAHWAVFLYIVGVFAACSIGGWRLARNPAAPRAGERKLNPIALMVFLGIAGAGVLFMVVTGRLNVLADQDYQFSAANDLLFINMAFSMLIPLAVVALVHNDFGFRSLALLAVVLLVLTQVGFRYRIVLLLAATISAFILVRRIRVRPLYVIPGTVIALLFVNAFGASRKYGNGLTLAVLEEMSWKDILTNFGGEIGPVFTLASVSERPIRDYALFDPWIVGFLRMVPSAIWPDKPAPNYMGDVYYAFTTPGVEFAGVAATQHVEALIQFGWAGLPFLACLYFLTAIFLISSLNKTAREARIAGYALVPVFFGFYMQTRGYFFQIFSDAVFMFGPLFFMSVISRVRKGGAGTGTPGSEHSSVKGRSPR